MATFVGYEVISPVGNFNYSTSYLFSAGPFQNAGLKATYAFSDKVSLMAGIFNDTWNSYRSSRLPQKYQLLVHSYLYHLLKAGQLILTLQAVNILVPYWI
jgi:hypothetical protein